MSEIKHVFHCDKCDKLLEKISIGHVCRACARFFDEDGGAMMDVNSPNVEKIQRIIDGGNP